MPEPHLRAADADREAVAASLGEHMSAGRLTLAEYDERVSRAYAARTLGDLAELTTDLPPTVRTPAPGPTPVSHPGSSSRSACGSAPWGGGRRRTHAWRSWVTTSLIVISIWLAASLSAAHPLPFWPIWVIGPWGAVLLAGRLGGNRYDDGRDRPNRQISA
jgi:hypothetical protein